MSKSSATYTSNKRKPNTVGLGEYTDEELAAELTSRHYEVELTEEQVIQIASMVYEMWQEQMKPPLFAYYDFPTWLEREKQRIQTILKEQE